MMGQIPHSHAVSSALEFCRCFETKKCDASLSRELLAKPSSTNSWPMFSLPQIVTFANLLNSGMMVLWFDLQLRGYRNSNVLMI